jgi:hypothetical protein
MTPKLIDELRRYAQDRAKLVWRAGRPVSETFARELVDDVHADICVGDLPWDPKCKLLDHLKAAIKRRTWLEIRHGRRVSFVSLQEVANDETMEQALTSTTRPDCDPIVLSAMTATVCQQLRSVLASSDVDAAAIAKCWSDGILEKDEIMRLTGLAGSAYECARRRLRRAIRRLTSELREAAHDLLQSAA